MAGNSATGYPFMDIAIGRLPRALAPLRGSFNGPYPLGVALAVPVGVLGVASAVAAILALLGPPSLRGSSPSLSAKPVSPSGGLFPARATAVLGTEEILGPRNESPSATFQEAKATEAILPRLSPCLRTKDGVKKISSLIPRFGEVSGSQGLQLLGSLFSSHEIADEQGSEKPKERGRDFLTLQGRGKERGRR